MTTAELIAGLKILADSMPEGTTDHQAHQIMVDYCLQAKAEETAFPYMLKLYILPKYSMADSRAFLEWCDKLVNLEEGEPFVIEGEGDVHEAMELVVAAITILTEERRMGRNSGPDTASN